MKRIIIFLLVTGFSTFSLARVRFEHSMVIVDKNQAEYVPYKRTDSGTIAQKAFFEKVEKANAGQCLAEHVRDFKSIADDASFMSELELLNKKLWLNGAALYDLESIDMDKKMTVSSINYYKQSIAQKKMYESHQLRGEVKIGLKTLIIESSDGSLKIHPTIQYQNRLTQLSMSAMRSYHEEPYHKDEVNRVVEATVIRDGKCRPMNVQAVKDDLIEQVGELLKRSDHDIGEYVKQLNAKLPVAARKQYHETRWQSDFDQKYGDNPLHKELTTTD